MPSLCSECGPVTPREVPGMAHLRCPNCGRVVMASAPNPPGPYPGPQPQAAPYGVYAAAQPAPYGAAQGYAAEWPAQQPGYGQAEYAYGQPGYGAPHAQVPNPYAGMPEYYAQRYDFGMVARRWLATMVDHVMLLVLLMGLLVAAELVLGEDGYAKAMPVVVPLVLAVVLGYFPWLEGKYGVTAGKYLVGVRVVDNEGNPPGLGKACIRTLLRLIEVNPVLLGGLIAGITVMASRNRQRLGDMAAGTYVLLKDDANAVLQARSAPLW